MKKTLRNAFIGTYFMLGCSCGKQNQNTDKPNVIFIYADDLGYGDLECYGAKTYKLQMSTVWHPKGYDLSTHTPPPLPVPHPDIPC